MSEGEGRSLTQWFVVLLGIAIVAFSFWLYKYVAGMEATGGSMRIHWLGALFYNIAGKLGLSAFVALFGAFLVWMGWTGWGSEEE